MVALLTVTPGSKLRAIRACLDFGRTQQQARASFRRSSALTSAVGTYRFCDAVWKARRAGDVILIKTLLYTGVRVSELVRIRIADVDFDTCRIRITQGKGGKDRVVAFPAAFKETLALHIDAQRRAGAAYMFESSWKKPYSDRGVRKILARYTQAAGITAAIPGPPAAPTGPPGDSHRQRR